MGLQGASLQARWRSEQNVPLAWPRRAMSNGDWYNGKLGVHKALATCHLPLASATGPCPNGGFTVALPVSAIQGNEGIHLHLTCDALPCFNEETFRATHTSANQVGHLSQSNDIQENPFSLFSFLSFSVLL